MSAVADADGWLVESSEPAPPQVPTEAPQATAPASEVPGVVSDVDPLPASEAASELARDDKGRFAAKPETPVVETPPVAEPDKLPSKRSPEGRKLTLRQEIDHLVREREAVRRDIESARQPKPAGQPEGFTYKNLDHFIELHPDHPDPLDGYYTAKAEYVADQRFEQYARRVQTQTAAQQLQTKGKQAYSDWDDTFASVGDVKISPHLEQVLLTDPDGHRLAYELAKHPDQHGDVLDASDGFALGVALGTLKARLGDAPLAPSRPQTPPAPPPIQPVGSSHAHLKTVSLDDKPFDQWSREDQRLWEIAERKKGRRV